MKRLFLFCLVLGCAGTGAVVAQQRLAAPPTPFQRLSQYDSLEIKLDLDLKKVRREKLPVWHPATLSIQKNGATLQSFQVSVQPRGNNRRETCDMPPLKIRFTPDPGTPDSLEKAFTLKMVIPCQASDPHETLILKECLVYELYQLMTPESFRTKLARLTIKDQNKKRDDPPVFCFFIEPETELAQRTHSRIYQPRVMSPRGLDESSFDRVCVFQYMVGNTDWTPYNRHNIRLLRTFSNDAVRAIPYDFDYAGVVDAPYAMPQPGAPIENVRQRYFFGLCRPEGGYQSTFDLFLAKKQTILDHCDRFPYLSKKDRQSFKTYISDFFPVIENPKTARREILEHCDNFKKG